MAEPEEPEMATFRNKHESAKQMFPRVHVTFTIVRELSHGISHGPCRFAVTARQAGPFARRTLLSAGRWQAEVSA